MNLSSLTVEQLEQLLAYKRQQEDDNQRKCDKSKRIARIADVVKSLEQTEQEHVRSIREGRATIRAIRNRIRATRRKLAATRYRLDLAREAIIELETMPTVTDDLVLQTVKGLYADRKLKQG